MKGAEAQTTMRLPDGVGHADPGLHTRSRLPGGTDRRSAALPSVWLSSRRGDVRATIEHRRQLRGGAFVQVGVSKTMAEPTRITGDALDLGEAGVSLHKRHEF